MNKNNPYLPPANDEYIKYEPPIVDMSGMIITFTIFIVLLILTVVFVKLFID